MARSSGVLAAALAALMALIAPGPRASPACANPTPTGRDTAAAAGEPATSAPDTPASAATPARCFPSFIVCFLVRREGDVTPIARR